MAPFHLIVSITPFAAAQTYRLLGLDSGADDYICKPYSPRDVVAHVRALLRRARWSEATTPGTPADEPALIIDDVALRATLRGQVLDLTPAEFKRAAHARRAAGTRLLTQRRARSVAHRRSIGHRSRRRQPCAQSAAQAGRRDGWCRSDPLGLRWAMHWSGRRELRRGKGIATQPHRTASHHRVDSNGRSASTTSPTRGVTSSTPTRVASATVRRIGSSQS